MTPESAPTACATVLRLSEDAVCAPVGETVGNELKSIPDTVPDLTVLPEPVTSVVPAEGTVEAPGVATLC